MKIMNRLEMETLHPLRHCKLFAQLTDLFVQSYRLFKASDLMCRGVLAVMKGWSIPRWLQTKSSCFSEPPARSRRSSSTLRPNAARK